MTLSTLRNFLLYLGASSRRASTLRVAAVALSLFGLSTTLRAATPCTDLLGEWLFENPLQLGEDTSGNGRDGQLVGIAAPSPGRELPGGVNATALSFDGSSYFNIPNGGATLDEIPAVTVEAWVKVDSHPQLNVFRARQPVALRSNAFQVANYTAPNTGWTTLVSESAPPVEEWFHIAGVFRGRDLRIYIDGRLAGLEQLEFDETDGAPATAWSLGARLTGGDQPFVGEIDEVRVWGCAREASQILDSAHDTDFSILDPTADPLYNADPLPNNDDWDALQRALNDAATANLEVVLPGGLFELSEPLIIPSGTLLRGAGPATVIAPLLNTADDVTPVLLLNAADRVTLRDFQIDGRATDLMQSSGHSGIVVHASSLVHVDGVTIVDLGRTPDLPTVEPSGVHLLVTAIQPDVTETIAGVLLDNTRSCERNVFENSTFADPEIKTRFGIRFKTNWLREEPVGGWQNFVRHNVVRENYLSGAYWNTVEIAGPATRHNLLIDNTVEDPRLVGIEADKGAIGNRYEGNTVLGLLQTGTETKSAMRIQGTSIDVSGVQVTYLAEDNIFVNNTIDGKDAQVNSNKFVGAVLMNLAGVNTFRDNVISHLESSKGAAKEAALLVNCDQVDIAGSTLVPNDAADSANYCLCYASRPVVACPGLP